MSNSGFYLLPVALLGLIFATFGCGTEDTATTDSIRDEEGSSRAVINGTVQTPSADAPQTAHVSVHMYGSRSALRAAETNSDGSFQLALDTAGIAEVTVAAPNRERTSVRPYLLREDTVSLDVQLAGLDTSSLQEPRLIGSFNDFKFRSGEVPLHENEGIFKATVPAPEDSVTYQILGVREERPRTAGGTDSDRRSYHPRLGYRSVVSAPEDSVQVTFDPARLPPEDGPTRARFADPSSTPASYHRFTESLRDRYRTYQEARRSDQVSADTISWSAHHRRVRATLQDAPSDQLQAAHLATYLRYTGKPEPKLARRALNSIPADNPAWSIGRFLPLPIRVASQLGEPDAYRPFFYEIARSNPSDELRAGMLFQMLGQAHRSDDQSRQRLLYSWLTGEYPGSRYVDIARKRYNPDRRIQAGADAPDFTVGALKGDQTFSREDFSGKHVLLDFWATWCQPCIEEFPTLRKARRQYSRDELAILSVSLDADRETVTTFLKERNLPWNHAFGDGAMDSQIAEEFEVGGLPKPVLVGPDGKIVAAEGSRLRGERLLQTLEQELGS